MSTLSFNEVHALKSSLRNEMEKQRPLWELQAEYIAPRRFVKNPGEKGRVTRARKIIKNQAGRSLRTYVSGMMNGATPRSRPWFNLTVNNTSKANSSAAKRYFHNTEAVINSHFQVSNLYRVLPMAYKDVGIFSNAAFAMLPHSRYGFYFYPYAIGTYAYSCDIEGDTNTFTRDFGLSVRQIVMNYAKLTPSGQIDWTGMPDNIQQMWKAARYEDISILSQTIVPNRNFNSASYNQLDPADRKFQCYTTINGPGNNITPQSSQGFRNEVTAGGLKQDQFLKVSGYNYFPVITPRSEVGPEENYGVDGPGEIALDDIMTLQEMERYRLEAIHKLVKPPMVGHASLRRHQASILAGGITYVDDQGAVAGFKPAFQLDPRLAELIADQQEYTQAIRSAFFEDLFLSFLGQETKTHVTAREIDEKASERMATLAPALGQLDQDMNSKLIKNAQIILEEAGRLMEKPTELQGEELRPEYISILAQAAKASLMNSIERMANFTASISTTMQDPSLLKLLKAEETIRLYADYVALPPTLLADEEEMAEIRKTMAESQAQAAQMAQQAQAAKTAKDFSQAKLGEGSVLDMMGGEEVA